MRLRSLSVASFAMLCGLSAGARPVHAASCTYTDLLGTFTVSADCEGLGDHSNLGNEQKRLWLGGTWGELNILEVPSPYKQDPAMVEVIMAELGRELSARRSPGGIQPATVGGQAALVVVEHKVHASSRSWVLHWQGRNLIVRAVTYGKRSERGARLESMSEVVASLVAVSPSAVEAEARPRVRERKQEATAKPAAAESAAEPAAVAPAAEPAAEPAAVAPAAEPVPE